MPRKALEIREIAASDRALRLEAFEAGRRVATAAVEGDQLERLESFFGAPREAVRAILETALLRRLSNELPRTTYLSEPRPGSQVLAYFASMFVHQEDAHISAGLVWYDVTTTMSGPEAIPTVVRNELRLAVNRILMSTSSDSLLVEKSLPWDSCSACNDFDRT